MRLILHFLVNAVALGLAAAIVPGITYGSFGSLLAIAVVFGFVNILIRPIVKLLSCPFILLTLGLFSLVLNALLLMLTAKIGSAFGIAFAVDGFWAAFLGALIVSLVSLVFSALFGNTRVKVDRS